MGDSFRRGSIRGGLSQLKQHWHFCSFSIKKGFSSLTILVLSGTSVIPILPTFDPKHLAETKETGSDTVIASPDEACRWQRDFSFFSDLQSEKKSDGESVPCTEVTMKVAFDEAKKPSVVLVDKTLTTQITELTAGYPLEAMAPTIAEYDRSVAALIVGIAKKESDWGKHVPRSSDGADCFNYWGFKGAGSRGTAMGHGCFGTREEAVHAVGNRIAELVAKRQTSEPKNMIIWKCGSSCATHSPESVRKWIADVDLYYRKIVQN